MAPLYTKKYLWLGFVRISLAMFYLFTGCGMQQVSKQPFDWTDLFTTFPACCAMQAALNFIDLRHAFRCRLVCCITYNQQIDFIVKAPLGVELMRGLIDKKGVTVVDRLHRVVYQWDYKQIKQQYHFYCNYLFIQSLLLGTVGSSIDNRVCIPDPLLASLTYIYDDLTGKIIGVQLIDTKQENCFKVLYRHKMAENKTFLSSITIRYALKNSEWPSYQGTVVLYKFHFKARKRPNIKLKIPAYYRKAVTSLHR